MINIDERDINEDNNIKEAFKHEYENQQLLEMISGKFDEAKEQGNHYITSHRDILDHPRAKELINDEFIPSQNEWEIRNSGQYKFIAQIKPKAESKKEEIKSETLDKFNFDIMINPMFYEGLDNDNLKKFLSEAHNIPINSDMVFIPIKINNINNHHYVLFIDNKIQTLSLFRIKNLRYINEQSNLIKLLNNILPTITINKQENYHYFLKSFTKELSEQLIFNERLLNEIYKDTNDIYKDKRILKQFNPDIK